MDQLRVMARSRRLSAAPRALTICLREDPGVRCTSPRALCRRPLRGLRTFPVLMLNPSCAIRARWCERD
jgi:hypothetical protein